MKVFKFFLIFALFFFAACDDGATRIVPEENGGESVTDGDENNDEDVSDSEADTADSDSDGDITDTTDTSDSGDDSDTADTSDSGNDSDTADTSVDGDTSDSGNDSDTADTSDSGNDADTDDDSDTVPDVDPESEEGKCYAAGGEWDAFADADDPARCSKIVKCKIPEGENADYIVWRSDQSYNLYYDFDDNTWVGPTYDTEYNDSGDEPKFCQYICAENARREDNKCKPICSAEFNGSNSRIAVSLNKNDTRLNLGDSWTIEAWVKQDAVSGSIPAIVRKGNARSVSYYLTAMYNEKTSSWSGGTTYKTMAGGFYYNSSINPFAATVGSNEASNLEKVWQNGWNHVALSYYTVEESDGVISMKKAYIRLYVNGKQVAQDSETVITSMIPNTNTNDLTIGYDESRNTFFKGKIDQLKISKNTYQSEFADALPKPMVKDDNTIVLYDFNNNAKDSSDNGLNGTGPNVIYSTDCAF